MNPGRPAVFLDRDGTLNEEQSYITRPEQLRLLPGVGPALQQLRSAGFVCVVVTNQSAIGRGMMTEADLERVHEEMNRQLAEAGALIDGIYYCPAAPETGGPDGAEHPERKPAPGMLVRAARELRLDLRRSWMIGDSARDIIAGQKAGCRGCVLVRTGHALDETQIELAAPCHVVADLPEAVRYVLAHVGD